MHASGRNSGLKVNSSTVTHIIGQLNQIQRFTEDLHEVENRRALKARAEEIRTIALTLSKLLVGMHNEEEDLRRRIRELEEELFQFYLDTELIIQSHPAMLRMRSGLDSRHLKAFSKCVSSPSKLSNARLWKNFSRSSSHMCSCGLSSGE